MSFGGSPKSPDYKGAAEAEAAASRDNVMAQTWANRPNQFTPWGNQQWAASQTVDPATGKPVTSWESSMSLDPRMQGALDAQMGLQQTRSQTAAGMAPWAMGAMSQPMDYGSMPGRSANLSGVQFGGDVPRPGDVQSTFAGTDPLQRMTAFGFGGTGQDDYRQKAQDAVWNLQKPMLDDQRSDLENQLANQGLARGSEAWDREMRRMDDSVARAQLQAIDSGRQESAQAFSQELQAGQFNNNATGQQYQQDLGRAQFGNQADAQAFQQAMQAASMGDTRALQEFQTGLQAGNFNNQNRSSAISEEMMRRGQGLDEMNALLSGQGVSMPSFPGFTNSGQAQAPDYTGAAGQQYQSNVDKYNAQQSQMNNLMQLGGSIASMFMFSDARLKEDIRDTGVVRDGVRVVHYRYRGLPGRFLGVIAQEVVTVKPDAVVIHPSGYLMVDYSKV